MSFCTADGRSGAAAAKVGRSRRGRPVPADEFPGRRRRRLRPALGAGHGPTDAGAALRGAGRRPPPRPPHARPPVGTLRPGRLDGSPGFFFCFFFVAKLSVAVLSVSNLT